VSGVRVVLARPDHEKKDERPLQGFTRRRTKQKRKGYNISANRRRKRDNEEAGENLNKLQRRGQKKGENGDDWEESEKGENLVADWSPSRCCSEERCEK